MKAIVFVGGGRITSALVAGLRAENYGRRMTVYDRNGSKMRALQRQFRVEIAPDLASALAQAQLVIVAVRPASVTELLAQVAGCQRRPKLWVSLAAGIPLKVLRLGLGAPVTWVRAMPSPASRIRQGLTGLCFDRSVTKSDRTRVRSLFAAVGQTIEIPEPRFDAFTATYSSSHGYHALAALAKAAQEAGLDRKTALVAAAHALADGILYWRAVGISLESLLHEAATPGGIAAATIEETDDAGYQKAVARGLRAGIMRAQRNARARP